MGEEIKKFKLREEKHVVTEVECMSWSPSMDLLAFGNKNGEVLTIYIYLILYNFIKCDLMSIQFCQIFMLYTKQ